MNNVGIFEAKPFEQITDEDWFRFFEVNVLSGVRLSRHYIAGMKEAAPHYEWMAESSGLLHEGAS